VGAIAPVNAERIDLPADIAGSMGWEALEVQSPGRPEELGRVLQELASEDCGHSWRNLLLELPADAPEGLAAAFLEQLALDRPTTLFTYTAVRGEAREPLAVAAISPRVSADFPHDGFPVLARCFLREFARGKGLYPVLVQHRLRRCEAHFGANLHAVHIGAARDPVLATLLGGLTGGPIFYCAGEEELVVAGVTYGVKDFIAPLGSWRQALLDSPEPLGLLFGRVLRGESISLGQIREALRVVEGMDEPAPAVRQWVELCDAIGVRD
jgi:hypothetical protein